MKSIIYHPFLKHFHRNNLIDFITKKDEVRICSGKLRILSPPTPTVARVQVGVGASHAILCLISR